MKQLRHLATIIVLVAISAAAQQTGTSTTTASTTADQALENRFREYADALTKRDLATLDRIWASEYTFINPRGELVTKAQRMTNLKSGATEFKSINPQREKLQVHGDVAIDIGRVTLEGTKYGGQEGSGDYRYMNVWVKRQGQWQMLANQITLIGK
ncbi:MAG TPA: nuclear transport factor 2 family protein [Terriglobales bacterium]|nr:nuclear transport factor 2 family protein [Terriglobales bacterium]